jgi:tetratricopeptide (TPR) repeat protein
MRDLTMLGYARSQPGVILHYLRLAFWPRGLVLDYAWPVANGVGAVGVPALVLAGLGSLTLWTFRRQPALGFLGVTFFLVLAPSSSVIPIKDLAFEHRMYLPLAALVVLAIVCGQLLIQRAAFGMRSKRAVAAGISAVLVATLTMLTVARNRDYRSAISMWTDVTVKRPENPRARNNLGDNLFKEGKVEEAIPQLRTALQLDPAYADAHNNLGLALVAHGKYEEAEAHYAEALRLNPNGAAVQNNLGVALDDQGRYAEAEAHYGEALRLQPDYAEAENSLGNAILSQGRSGEATAHFLQALRLKPDYVEAHSNLGNALAGEGKVAAAVDQYLQALRMRPGYAEVHYNLALALAAQGKGDEARAHVAEAVRLRPDLEKVYRKSGLLEAR